MTSPRRRRSPAFLRTLAILAPAAALALAGTSFLVGGLSARLAALAAALLCVVLGVALSALDRRRRVEVAHVRTEQASAYDVLHAQHSAEHLQFTGYMVGLIDSAEQAMDALRGRLDGVELTLRSTQRAVDRSESAAQRAEYARSIAELRAGEAERSAMEAEAMIELLTSPEEAAAAAQPVLPAAEPELVPSAARLAPDPLVDPAELWSLTEAPTVVDLSAREVLDAIARQDRDRRSA